MKETENQRCKGQKLVVDEERHMTYDINENNELFYIGSDLIDTFRPELTERSKDD